MSIRRLFVLLVVVLIGQGFSCRAQVMENDLFYFENPQSLYTTVGGLLSSSQAKYSMVVGKKNNSIPMVDYIKRYSPFGAKNVEVRPCDLPNLDYYFGNRSKVYIVAWRGKERRMNLVNEIYKSHRAALRSRTNMQINGNVVFQAGNVEIEEKVTFKGDTEALHRALIMKLSQSLLSAMVPPMDFYYDLYQYYDSEADATVVALFYRIEINPDMRQKFPGEFSDTMRLDFEKHFKLKSNAPFITVSQPLVPPELIIEIPEPELKDSTETKVSGQRLPVNTGGTIIGDPPVPEPGNAPVLKRSLQTTISIPVSGREVLQFAEDSRSVYILYKRGPLLAIDKQGGDKREVVTGYEAMDVSGVAVDRKGRLLLYTRLGLLRWNGKNIATSPVIFKYDGYTGRNSKVTVTYAGDLLVYGGGSSSPTVLLSEDGKPIASSDKLKGDRVLMMPDGTIWASSTWKVFSGGFTGVPVEHSYGDESGNSLSGLADMCPRGNDLLVCGKELLVFQNGKWESLYKPNALHLTCLVVDTQKTIWLASNEGLMCMGKNGKEPVKKLTSIMTPGGKKDLGYIKGLYVDTAGNLWIVTLSDVIVHNPEGLMGLLP